MSDITALTPPEAPLRRLTTVAAVDVCGYSRLAETDEAAALRIVQLVAQVFGEIAARRRGRIFHRAGDGFLAEFPSASDGVLAALELVEDLRKRDTLSPTGVAAKVRAGVHVGDVVDQPSGDLLGHGVNVAARLQGEAEPGGVLVSLHAVNLIRDKIDASFRRRGPLALKHIDEPVVAFDAVREGARRRPLFAGLRRAASARPAVVAAGLLGILLLGLNFVMLNGVGRLQRDGGGEQEGALVRNAEANVGRQEIPLDARAVREILHRLQASRHDDDRVVLSLIAQGDLRRAIEALKIAYRDRAGGASRESRVRGLLDIAALCYAADPECAKAHYREVISIEADNFEANFRLGRILLTQGEIKDAQAQLAAAIQAGKAPPEARFFAEEFYAFSFLHRHDLDGAISRLEPLLARAKDTGSLPIISRTQTDLGIAYAMSRRHAEAKNLLVPIMIVQKEKGLDEDLARALGAMGLVAERDGEADAARSYYSQAYETETALNRIEGMAETLLALARVEVGERNNDGADIRFAEALRLSRENGFANGVAFSLIGQALIASRRGDQEGACRLVSDAASVDNGEIAYGKFSKEAIAETGCPFGPIAVATPR